MKNFQFIIPLFISVISYAQPELPFYYEKNLPLYGQPQYIEEYYYEYHTQVKAHYYIHVIEYDALGRVKTHAKSNVGLVDPEDIPPTFAGIIDPRPVTITYLFTYYGNENRLTRFTRHQYQKDVGTLQQDEEWIYDDFGMLTEHNFWEVQLNDTVLKNPSSRRAVYRDPSGKVEKIEKYTYSYLDGDLIVSELTLFSYDSGLIDSVATYRITNGTRKLHEKRFNLSFERYDPFNTDSLLYASFTAVNQAGDTSLNSIHFDEFNRELLALTTTLDEDTISITEWAYEPGKTTRTNDKYYVLEIYYDETGYETYREEFEGGNSLAVPADFNTRAIEDGKIAHALLEIWDPVALFYRKDTEYIYDVDITTNLAFSDPALTRKEIFPNPTRGTVFLPEFDRIERLELISLHGTVIQPSVNEKINLDLPNGIYMLYTFYKDGSFQTSKLVIRD